MFEFSNSSWPIPLIQGHMVWLIVTVCMHTAPNVFLNTLADKSVCKRASLKSCSSQPLPVQCILITCRLSSLTHSSGILHRWVRRSGELNFIYICTCFFFVLLYISVCSNFPENRVLITLFVTGILLQVASSQTAVSKAAINWMHLQVHYELFYFNRIMLKVQV